MLFYTSYLSLEILGKIGDFSDKVLGVVAKDGFEFISIFSGYDLVELPVELAEEAGRLLRELFEGHRGFGFFA